MKKRRLIDTNLIVRHFVQDHPEHGKVAGRLFEACDKGELELVILPTVLAESVFVLESFYKHPRPNIAQVASKLITSPGIEIDRVSIQVDALSRYSNSKAHFVDCLIAATAAADDIEVATFDSDFRRFPDVQVNLKI